MNGSLSPTVGIVPGGLSVVRRGRQAAKVVQNRAAILQLLVEIRTRAGLSQKQLAARLGVTYQEVSNIERGSVGDRNRHRVISTEALTKWCEACGARLVVEFPEDN